MFSEEESLHIDRALCSGPHRGCHIYLTDGISADRSGKTPKDATVRKFLSDAAIQRQKTEITTDKDYQLLLYPKQLQKEAILKAQELRKNGALIELLCMDETKSKEDYQAYADRTGRTTISKPDLRNL